MLVFIYKTYVSLYDVQIESQGKIDYVENKIPP